MEYRNSLQQFRQDVVRGSFLARPIPRSGLTSVPVHVGGGLGLQVPPCVLHRLEVGRDFHQRDADAAELADVDKILDGFHQFLRAFLTVFHHGLAICPVFLGKPVVEKAVDGQHVCRLNRCGIAIARSVADHYPYGICLVGGTAAKEVQNGLRLRADCGSAFFLSLFLVRGILNRGIPDTRFHVL